MQGLSIAKTVTVSLTADQWELYNAPGRDAAAAALSAAVTDVLNSDMGNYEKMRSCYRLLGQYAEFGAADSEGYQTLDNIFEVVFGNEEF